MTDTLERAELAQSTSSIETAAEATVTDAVPAVTRGAARDSRLDRILVCSFYTADDYYRRHADALRANLERIGVAFELQEVVAGPGEDWADICRKKIGFLASVCEANPDKKVFWMDVDCQLLDLPDLVRDFSADIIGFQRGFGSPMSIGYERRSRFWEPCFFGINTTPAARRFIDDAWALERHSLIKATDDYFFEESWRANAERMSFQIIPSTAVLAQGRPMAKLDNAFFLFGSSGNVEHFKGKVVQHARSNQPKSMRRRMLDVAKRIERALPRRISQGARRIADTSGVTSALTGGTFGEHSGVASTVGARARTQSARRVPTKELVLAGQRGDVERLAALKDELEANFVVTEAERQALRAAESFAHYANIDPANRVSLSWWVRPFPGNFGDWLSPLVIGHTSRRGVVFQSPVNIAPRTHLVSIGSIGRFIKPNSIVVGTGVSADDVEFTRKARYVSLRGPVTAELLQKSGGPSVESFGDPGLLISRVMPVERPARTNGRIALVRHYTHAGIPLRLPESFDELSVLASHPDDIRELVSSLARYDAVVTSAMHILIACNSYGIPCSLVTFEGFESTVHGTGLKYVDYSRGAGLKQVRTPVPVGLDLTSIAWDDLIVDETVTDDKLDEIEAAIVTGLELYDAD